MSHQPLAPHLAYLSSTLKGAAAGLSPTEGREALECFQHWRSECERIGDGSAERIAFTIHEIIDSNIAHMRATSKHAPEIKCRKGCAACCHVHVDIFAHEAVLLHQLAEQDGIAIDRTRLERQAPKDETTWHELSVEDSRCVFLDDAQECRVYEHRPGSCRKYHVLTDPELCDMRKYPGGKVGIVFDLQAEIVHSAAMTVYGVGNMAAMLLKHQPTHEGSSR